MIGRPWHSQKVARGHAASAREGLARDPHDVYPFRLFLAAINRMLPGLPERARLLDVGCGVGQYGELLARHHPGRFEYLGSDLPAMIREARRMFPARRFVEADVTQLEPPLDGFDVVLASSLVTVLRKPWPVIEWLLCSPAPHVVIHRQRLGDRERAATVPAYGRRSRVVWLRLTDLKHAAAEHGRTVTVLHEPGETESLLLFERHAGDAAQR